MLSRRRQEEKAVSHAWYNTGWILILWLFLFWPVGLYGTWKSTSLPAQLKAGITFIVGGMIYLLYLGFKANT
jgi:hypothetical protein